MAQPYLLALDHAEWNAKRVLTKHYQSRPLGMIETEHNFKPRQPVLSCRMSDIDLTGTRTYRAKSTSEIIEEQHKLIHRIYTSARNKSAPANRSRLSPRRESAKSTPVLRKLSVKGSNRPVSSPVKQSRPVPGKKALDLKPRPKTSISHVKPQTETVLKIRVDPDISRTAEAFYELNKLVHNQWEPENHGLDEGQFVRGRKKEHVTSSLDPKTGNQWMAFGGGQKESSAGIVDAFSIMKNSEHYSVDGNVGSTVARQLRKGDKIRIGVNGELRSQDIRMMNMMDRYQKQQEYEECQRVIPLCWDDQLEQPGARLVDHTGKIERKEKPNYFESHPVTFNTRMTPPASAKSKTPVPTERTKSGYAIKARKKGRVGIDGNASHSVITNIEIDRRSGVEDDMISCTSVEDILEKKIRKHSESPQNQKYSGHASVTSLESQRDEDSYSPFGTLSPPNDEFSEKENMKLQNSLDLDLGANSKMSSDNHKGQNGIALIDQGLEALVVGNPNAPPSARSSRGQRSAEEPRSSRGATTPSRGNATPHSNCSSASTSSRGQRPGNSGRGQRLPSPRSHRPKLAKSGLHKGAVTPGSASKGDQTEPSYIQISQQIRIKGESVSQSPSPSQSPRTSSHSDAIRAVNDYNQARYDSVPRNAQTEYRQAISLEPAHSPMQPKERNTPTHDREELDTTLEQTDPPPPTPTLPTDSLKVAFNIPTGEDDSEHDNYSVHDTQSQHDLQGDSSEGTTVQSRRESVGTRGTRATSLYSDTTQTPNGTSAENTQDEQSARDSNNNDSQKETEEEY